MEENGKKFSQRTGGSLVDIAKSKGSQQTQGNGGLTAEQQNLKDWTKNKLQEQGILPGINQGTQTATTTTTLPGITKLQNLQESNKIQFGSNVKSNIILPGISEPKYPNATLSQATQETEKEGNKRAKDNVKDTRSMNEEIHDEMVSGEYIPLLKQGAKQTWNDVKKFAYRKGIEAVENFANRPYETILGGMPQYKLLGKYLDSKITNNLDTKPLVDKSMNVLWNKYYKYEDKINKNFDKWVDQNMNKIIAKEYKDSGGVWESIKSGNTDMVKYGLMQGFSTSVIPMIPGIIAGIVTKNPTVTASIAFASTAPIEDQEAYEEAMKEGATRDEATQIGRYAGIINGTLETIGEFLQLKGLLKPLKKNITKEITKKTTRQIISRGLLERNKGVFGEALTEGTQEFVTNALIKTINENKDIFEGVLDSMIVGGVLGGGGSTLGAGGAMIEEHENNKKIDLATDIEALNYVMQGEERKAQRMQQKQAEQREKIKQKILSRRKANTWGEVEEMDNKFQKTEEENAGFSSRNEYADGRNIGWEKDENLSTNSMYVSDTSVESNGEENSPKTDSTFFSTDENGEYIEYDDGNRKERIYAGGNKTNKNGSIKSQFTNKSKGSPRTPKLKKYYDNFNRLVKNLSNPNVKVNDYVQIGKTGKGKNIYISKGVLAHIIEDHGVFDVNTLIESVNNPTGQKWESETTKTGQGRHGTRPYMEYDIGSEDSEIIVGIKPDSWEKDTDTAEYYGVVSMRESNAPTTPADNVKFQLKYEEKGYTPGVANKKEKSISGKEGIKQKNTINDQTVEELAEKYGVKVEVIKGMIEILRKGKREGYAYGKYRDQLLTLSEQIKESTAPHELLHAIFDMIDPETKTYLIAQVMKSEGWNAETAEERLADSFSNFFRTGKIEGAPKSTWGRIKIFFKRVRSFINGMNKWRNELDEIFTDIITADGIVDLQSKIDESSRLNKSKEKMRKRFMEYRKNSQKIQSSKAPKDWSKKDASYQIADESVYELQPLERIEQMEKNILDEYGETDNPGRVAFIDNKGRWINGNMGGYGNYRDVDHREIAQTAFDDTDIEFNNGTDGLVALQAQTGLVRVNYNDGYMNIDTVYELMPSQREGLMKFADENIEEVNVDITDQKTGRTVKSDTFMNVRDAVRWIDRHFAESENKYQKAGDINSPAFKKRFGDSKVVDKDGNPLVVYHGTPYGGFTVFENRNRGSIGDEGYFGRGWYFTNDKALAKDYSDDAFIDEEERTNEPGAYGNVEIKEVYLKIENPYVVNEKDVEYEMGSLEKLLGTKNPSESTEKLKDEGYDGVIYEFNSGTKEYTVFEPNQIKSATDNVGTYDENNDDIRYQKADSDQKDNDGRTLSNGQAEYFKDSKVRDDNGNLLRVYHGTNSEYTVYDSSLLGAGSGDLGFFGDGWYFATHKGEAGYYGRNIMEGYLNITNPFYYGNMTKIGNKDFGSNAYVTIRNLGKIDESINNMEMNGHKVSEIGDMVDDYLNNVKLEKLNDEKDPYNGWEITYWKVTEYGKSDIKTAMKGLSENGMLDEQLNHYMMDKIGYLKPRDLIEEITDEARFDKTKKSFSQILQDKGYDGIVVGDNAYQADEIVAFRSNEFKNIDNLNPTDNEDIRYQRVYHGSPADFDRFDSSHMGEGEGAQAHGWGHYVAVDEKTGRHYAQLHQGDLYSNIMYKGESTRDMTRRGIDREDVNQVAPSDIMTSIVDGISRRKYDESMKVSDIAKDIINQRIEVYSNSYEKSGDWIKNAETPEEKAEMQRRADRLRDLIKAYKDLDEKDFDRPQRNLYEVEIPDPVKADTPTGSNYWEEDGKLGRKEVDKILTALDNYKIIEEAEKGEDLPRGDNGSLDLNKKRTLEGLKKDNEFGGGYIYNSLSMLLGSDKEASKFLESLGYDGIHYFGGRDGEAYVIFNDDALEIKNHERYQKADSDQKDNDGRTLSNGQAEYFKDSKVRDDNGNLLRVYHGTKQPEEFTVFDNSKSNGYNSNSSAHVGNRFTDSKKGAENFAGTTWAQGKPRAMEGYLNIKNPKIYETRDVTKEKAKAGENNKKLIKDMEDRLNVLGFNTKLGGYESLTGMPSLRYNDKEFMKMMGYLTSEAMVNDYKGWGGYSKLGDFVNALSKAGISDAQIVNEAKYLHNLYNDYMDSEKKYYSIQSDAYDQYQSDISTYGDNARDAVSEYKQDLIKQGYDGIIIKNTEYDGGEFGGTNTQYVSFNSNQFKNIDNLNPTDNEDIRFQKAGNTKSANFKKRFDGSKVVKENGKPQIVYHGTTAEFTVFNKIASRGIFGDGYYFTNRIGTARQYGYGRDGRVMKVYLAIKNPYVADNGDGYFLNTEKLKEEGYDGVQAIMGSETYWVAFDSNQIKSATDNVGTYDINNDDIRYQRVYHGSPADFERFDSSHMGEGEGDQVHGWGHYVAVDPKTGKSYAETLAGPKWKGKETFELAMELDGNKWNVIREVTEKMTDEGVSAKEGIESSIRRHEYQLEEAKNDLKEQKWVDDKKFYENKIENQKKMLDFARGLNESDFESSIGRRNFYEVEIPDIVKADTPTGTNYFEENKVLTRSEIEKILNKLLKRKTQGAERVKNAIDYDLKDGEKIDGRAMVFNLRAGLGNKKASKFLESLGYDGIHYFGGKDGEAYVIFNDDALEIKNHEKYQKTEYEYDENGNRKWIKFGDNSEFDPSIFGTPTKEEQIEEDKENEKSNPFYNAWMKYNNQNYKDDQLTLGEFVDAVGAWGERKQEEFDKRKNDIAEVENDPKMLELQLKAVKLSEEETNVGKKFGKNVSKEVRDRQQAEVEKKREDLSKEIFEWMYPGLRFEEATYDDTNSAWDKEAEWEMLGKDKIEEKLKYFKKDKNGNWEKKDIKIETPQEQREKIEKSGNFDEVIEPKDRVIQWETPEGQKGRLDKAKDPRQFKKVMEKINSGKSKTKVELKDVTNEVRALERYKENERAEKERRKKEKQEEYAKKKQEEYKRNVRLKAFQRLVDMQRFEKYPFLSEDEIKQRWGFTDEEWKKITEQLDLGYPPKKRNEKAVSDFNKAVDSEVKFIIEGLSRQNNMKQKEAEKNLGEIGEIDLDVLLGKDEEKGQKEVEEFERIAKEEKKKSKKEKNKRLEQAREDVTNVEIDKERENSKSEKERVDKIIKSTKSDNTVWGSIKKTASDIITPVSTRIREISPKIYRELMRYFQNKDILTNQRLKEIDPFLKAMGKIRKENPVRFMDIWVALANRNIGYANGLLQEYGVKIPTKLLDTIYDEAEDVGLNINYLGSYYPLSVKAPKSFLEELMKVGNGDIASEIEKKIQQESQKKGGPLDESEITAIINSVIAGEEKGPDVNTGNKHLKKRNTEIERTPKMLEYCDDPISTLIGYIEGMTQSIERAKFLGKSRSGNVHTLADYVYNAKNGLDPDQQDELMELLKSVFNDASPNKFYQTWRDIATLTTLGSPSSTLTQIGDLSFSIYENGWREALKATWDIFMKRKAFDLKDMGVINRGEEYTNINSQKNLLQKAIHNVFKLTFFSNFDTFGKSTFIQSTWNKRRKRALKGENGDPQLIKDIMKITDDEYTTIKIINDLRNGVFSEDVALVMYMKLGDIQPLTKAQMPKAYLDNPNGRLFYQFKTFGIKQLDYVLQETKEQTRGFKNLSTTEKFLRVAQIASMIFIMTLMGAGASELKDITMRRRSNSLILRWLFGEEVGSEQIWDKIGDSALQLFGLSRYTVMQMKSDPVDAITNLFTTFPATNLIAYPFKDINKAFKDDGSINWRNPSAYQLIPVIGKYRYWIYGGGQDKQQEALDKEKKTTTSGGSSRSTRTTRNTRSSRSRRNTR